ncbi:hypothetical protein Zmor_020580 [Zophobas morio]|uniref:Peptidase S1 domain-containing protein n=1 Tax=Zophobas morio TaxID=2755281 RepID=A0AA38I3R7_9CUCU|nr:hypothetical protein Zmor_020580 [Zophobas morio]
MNSHPLTSQCQEYGKAVYVQKESPTLTTISKVNNVSECGIVSVPLIVGGELASEKEFPHMAVIGFGLSPDAELKWDCGGSLISELYVLTAAHCLESRQLGPSQKIRFGILRLQDTSSNLQERLVTKRIPHPEHKSPLKANDIALIQMDQPIIFTPSVRPACLSVNDIRPGNKALATGFGKVTYEAESGSESLMKVTLTIYSNDKCEKILPAKETIRNTMLCAGKLSGGKDTCQGDSGGPLQTVLKDPYCMYSIAGVTSFGKFCGFANAPAIYTKVSSYVSWIESVVWP